MSAPIITTQNWYPEAYDLVIDVRAPSEFAEDHIVGAVNMPVLSDAERVEVGTLYKQTSPFAARKRGQLWYHAILPSIWKKGCEITHLTSPRLFTAGAAVSVHAPLPIY